MKTQLSNIRVGAALSIPMVIAAGTVALAGYLFTSSAHPAAPRHGHVYVLDDGPCAAQPMGPQVFVLDDSRVADGSSGAAADRG